MKTIAWDVDDVLNNLTQAWLESAWRPAHPDCTLPYDACAENPPHRLLGVPLEDYLSSLDAFRRSENGRNLTPSPDALAWFARYGDQFRHIALTATPLVSAPDSANWVLRHFGLWIRSFHFVPSPRPSQTIPVYDRTKAEFLVRFARADLLIDDNPANIAEADNCGVSTLLIPQPWNHGRCSLAIALETIPALLQATTPNSLQPTAYPPQGATS